MAEPKTNGVIQVEEKDVDAFHDIIQKVITDSKGDANRLMLEFFVASKELAKVRMRSMTSLDHGLTYDNCGNEYLFWAMGLLAMDWSVEILGRKAEVGHCNTHRRNDPAQKPCMDGSKFHQAIYQDCLESFDTTLKLLKVREGRVSPAAPGLLG